MEYIEVSILLSSYSEELAEIIIAEIVDLGYDSFMTEEPYVKAYVPKEIYSASNLKTILSGYDGATFTASLMPDKNWNEQWESDFEPVIVEGLCTLKATYHTGLKRTRYNITIEPQMAFGTGHHQTTFMMMSQLLGYIGNIKDKVVMDMGCGTGVLAFLAAKMGAKAPVYAIDIDPIATRSAKANARRNKVATRTSIHCGDASLLQAGKYDLLLANINRNILIEDMSTYARCLRPDGELITSGFYTKDVPMLRTAAERCGLQYVSEMEREGWASVKFKKVLPCR